jgi:hypothetical protein
MKTFIIHVSFLLLFLLMVKTSTVSARQTVPVVDSALLDRISVLEQKVAFQKSGEDHFMLAGLATIGFARNKTVNKLGNTSDISKTNSFGDADHFEFSPMLLWRHGTKFLLEFEPSFNNDGLSVNWADVSYFAAPGLIIRAGYLVIPFGIYNKRLAAGWIDKLATDPIGLDVPSSTDYGVEIEGGLPLGDMKWSYDIAVTNGMRLMSDGQLQGAGITDNNINKTISGRLALLPFSNSSLELGVSGLTGKINDAGSPSSTTKTNMFAFDLNYVKSLSGFLVNIKGQYNLINVDHQDYIKPEDSSLLYSFNNKTKSGFAQIALRPTFTSSKVFKNFELAFRYAHYTTPVNSLWGQKSDQIGISLNYWLNWRTVMKLTHENIDGNSTINNTIGTNTGNTKSTSWFLQFAIQL